MSKRRLSHDEFMSATKNLTIRADIKSAAYSYMVGGKKMEQIAQEADLIKSTIQRKVRHIWEEHQKLNGDWVTEAITLPKSEMEKVKERAKALKRQFLHV